MAPCGSSASSHRSPSPCIRDIILDCIEHLPALPALAAEALQDSEAAELLIAHCTSTLTRGNFDPVAFSGRFGRHALIGLCMSRSIDEAIFGSAPDAACLTCRSTVWRHGLQVAAMADCLADEIHGACDRTVLFAAALTHDIGQLLLGRFMPRSYARVVRRSRALRLSLRHTERDTLGLDHAAAGRAMAAHWGLPQTLQQAIGSHHDAGLPGPAAEAQRAQVTLIRLAEATATGPRLAHHQPIDSQTRRGMHSRLGMDDDASARAINRANKRFVALAADAQSMLGIPPACTPRVTSPLAGIAAPVDLSAEWAPDDPSGRCMAAIRRFCRAADQTRGTAALARRMVGCVAEALGIDSTAAFIVEPGGHACQYAVLGSGKVQTGLLLAADTLAVRSTQNHRDSSPTDSWAVGHGSWGALLTKPHGLAERLCERHRRHWIPSTPLLLPITAMGHQLGGVLLDGNVIGRLNPGTWRDVFETLRDVFAAAAQQATRLRQQAREIERLTDVGDRLMADTDRLVRSRSLAMLAEMAAGAAHEWNTPLAVISGRAQLLARDATDAEVKKAAQTIDQHARRCSDIISEMLAFARPEDPRPRRSALKSLIDAVLGDRTDKTAAIGVEIVVNVSQPDVSVWADPAQVTTALGAIVTNAFEAMPPEKGRLVINSASRPSDEWVVIEVEDNGRGMSPDVLEHAFDPFFSQRPAGRGRGLGLSLAQRLIELNQGRLWIESRPGHGTKVVLSLPTVAPNRP